jgi:hypothetical protein
VLRLLGKEELAELKRLMGVSAEAEQERWSASLVDPSFGGSSKGFRIPKRCIGVGLIPLWPKKGTPTTVEIQTVRPIPLPNFAGNSQHS